VVIGDYDIKVIYLDMATKKGETKKTSVISMRALAEAAGVNYDKLFKNLSGKYNSLTQEEKIQLMNAFHDEVNAITPKLGFLIDVIRIKDPSPTPKRARS
jgi:cupin superfamily acireductone dioxygenase involved in methionine salvage